jgi:hypothetical protein
MPIGSSGGGRPPRALRHARLATATLFFANGCGLGSWLPHIPDVKLWHGLSDGVLGLALLAIAGGAVAALPVAGALTARCGSRPTSRAAALLFCAVLPCRCSRRASRSCSPPSSCSPWPLDGFPATAWWRALARRRSWSPAP